MRLLICCLLFLSTAFSSAYAQQPGDKIIAGSENWTYLEHLVKIKVDSVRKLHHCQSLVNNDILFTAASSHADYLIQNNMMGHFEPDRPERFDPGKRVRISGGIDFSVVGENVALSYIRKPMRYKFESKHAKGHISVTYSEVANDLVTGWVHSPKHFANMINPAFNTTGVAIYTDSTGKKIIGVQVFGKLEFHYPLSENKQLFPYPDDDLPSSAGSFDSVPHQMHHGPHFWHLKRPRHPNRKCVRCEQLQMPNMQFELTPSGKNVSLYTDDVDLILRLLKHHHDGMALEFVSYKSFECGNPEYYTTPSRRNQQDIFNGKVTRPIYRYKLLKPWRLERRKFRKNKFKAAAHILTHYKGFKELLLHSGNHFKRAKDTLLARWDPHIQPGYWQHVMGSIPDGISGYAEINVVILQKGKVCRIVHRRVRVESPCNRRWTQKCSVYGIRQNWCADPGAETMPWRSVLKSHPAHLIPLHCSRLLASCARTGWW